MTSGVKRRMLPCYSRWIYDQLMRIFSMRSNAIICLTAVILFGSLSFAQAADLSDEEFANKMEAYLKDSSNLEKIGSALERFLTQKRTRDAKKERVSEQKRIEAQFKNPVQIDLGESPSKGPEDAKVTIVEFSDFQCPYCQRGANVVESVLKDYPNDVRLVFKHLPLGFHQHAQPAARASLAAGRQGKFWEMHDMLFKNQRSLGEEAYVKFAGDLGLDVEKFKADYADPKIAELVADDNAQAKKIGSSRHTRVFCKRSAA